MDINVLKTLVDRLKELETNVIHLEEFEFILEDHAFSVLIVDDAKDLNRSLKALSQLADNFEILHFHAGELNASSIRVVAYLPEERD